MKSIWTVVDVAEGDVKKEDPYAVAIARHVGVRRTQVRVVMPRRHAHGERSGWVIVESPATGRQKAELMYVHADALARHRDGDLMAPRTLMLAFQPA